MTNRTPAQISHLAERCIDLFYDDDLIDADTIDTFIDEAGMDTDLPRRDALANALAFDLAELRDESESDDDPFFDAADIDAIADAIADKLLARL